MVAVRLSPAHSKAAKRRNRRAFNAATRADALKLKVPQMIGLVAAAELAVEEEDADRAKHDAKRQAVKRARQTPMERYKARGEITSQHFTDAERLWSDYVQSGLTANTTGSYGQSTPGGSAPTPGCGPRYLQYSAAMRAVGIILSPVLAWVVFDGEPADQWALKAKRPAREGIITLRLALDALGAHYRGGR
jgi:hypothetical protein